MGEGSSMAFEHAEIQRLLSNSPYYLKLADSILRKLDRRTLAKLLASYMYFKSSGKPDSYFVRYILMDDLPLVLTIASSVAPILAAAILSDRTFRSLFASLLIGTITKKTGKR